MVSLLPLKEFLSFSTGLLYGDRLPILNQAMKEGSLWDIYKSHYEAHNYPFYKKAVKAMHYASVLGGGKQAFREAIHRHNLDNPDERVKDMEGMIDIHRKSPIYKELKSLLVYIQKQWDGKLLVLHTGERFRVKGFRRLKNKDGSTRLDTGNLLTVLSAYLQSKEVLLMSYMLLTTRQLYIPLLWQHDGITIIPTKPDFLVKMQEQLNKACKAILGPHISIPLEISEMDKD